VKLKPYKEILKMAKEMVDEALAPVRAMRAKKQAELEVAKMDEKIATHEAKIQEICVEKDINFDKLISAQDELALMERRKKQFARIIEELFPED